MKSITRHINRLLLDPNNYRFIDRPEYEKIPDEKLTDTIIQKRTRYLLTGRNNDLIQDLIVSFKENGFLPVNQIQVKEIQGKSEEDINYLVLEGNRRIATLKYLYEEFKEKGISIGKLTESSFRSVPVMLHSGDSQKEHLIVMGLDHITGKKRWSPINQAQLIEDLINEHEMNEDEICRSLGITKVSLRRSRRTLALIQKYRTSDFGDQFKGTMYSIFEEIIKNTKLKNWLCWDDVQMCPTEMLNTERLFSWISQDEIRGRDDFGEQFTQEVQEPIITRASEIRELSKYIDEPNAIEQMESSRSITEGFIMSNAVGESKFSNALDRLKQDVSTVFNFSEHMQSDHHETIQQLRGKIDRLLPASNNYISPYTGIAPLYDDNHTFFKQINIEKYRIIKKLKIHHLSRVNIFVGKNNSGKTSLLEAIYLLSQLNDIHASLELERYRGKFDESFNPKWLARNLNEEINISGSTDQNEVFVSILPQKTNALINKSGYISSLLVTASVDQTDLESNVNIFSDKSPEIYYQQNYVLCHAAMTSPYRFNESLLKKAHSIAVKQRYMDDIIVFLRENIDPDLIRIEMVNIDGENRFYVNTSSSHTSFDITKYGEGIQRIFEIALLMGYCQNGILCIDEFESAIHKSLLIAFSKYVHQLAEKFNVQVFLSTHSKECIDAFIKNKYNNHDITAFSLKVCETDNIMLKYVEGERLESLLESVDIDIRG
jgi:AAA15 family ATPase/GTPase